MSGDADLDPAARLQRRAELEEKVLAAEKELFQKIGDPRDRGTSLEALLQSQARAKDAGALDVFQKRMAARFEDEAAALAKLPAHQQAQKLAELAGFARRFGLEGEFKKIEHAALKRKYEELRDQASEYYEQGRRRAMEMEQGLEQYVQEKPIQALLIAAGVGMLLGMLWKRG